LIIKTLVCLFAISLPALAHQPVLNEGKDYPVDAPFEITEPEISKAFYAELNGEPQYYRIVSEIPFRFYAGITVPKIDGCPLTQRFSFDVLDANLGAIVAAEGETFEWWPWFENFGKRWYWVGPEVGAEFKSDRKFAAGTYFIRVYNAENMGRYVLAVGDIESFPTDVIIKTMIVLPGINRNFWDNVTC
jgi:hypothetical protein